MKLDIYIEQGILEMLLKLKFIDFEFYQFYGQNLEIFYNFWKSQKFLDF